MKNTTARAAKVRSKGLRRMNLVMLDIDGTLTQSFKVDGEVFELAIAEVLGCSPGDLDLNGFVDVTSLGVTQEALERHLGRSPRAEEIEGVKRRVLHHLELRYRESPGLYGEVPGASLFLERLRKLDGVGIAIGTGAWRSEAQYKLRASSVSADDIPMATSDDDRNRMKIMEIAAGRARDFYGCSRFERVVYLGDGPWDLQASRALGYTFIGIGPRVQALKDREAFSWYQDYRDPEAVFASIAAALKPLPLPHP
jgi:phosphoglycolate phosphatase-like HAD superfamily hydrolase